MLCSLIGGCVCSADVTISASHGTEFIILKESWKLRRKKLTLWLKILLFCLYCVRILLKIPLFVLCEKGFCIVWEYFWKYFCFVCIVWEGFLYCMRRVYKKWSVACWGHFPSLINVYLHSFLLYFCAAFCTAWKHYLTTSLFQVTEMSEEESLVSPMAGVGDPDTLDLSNREMEKLARATPELILNTTTLLLDTNKLTRLDNIHTYQCLEKVKSETYFLKTASWILPFR